MDEYLSFKKLITPLLIQVLFWGAVIGNTIESLFYSHGFLEAIFYLIIGPILIRIFCEGLIVIFEINNTLTEIRDQGKLKPVATPPASPTPPIA
jgi:hypothetical protein